MGALRASVQDKEAQVARCRKWWLKNKDNIKEHRAENWQRFYKKNREKMLGVYRQRHVDNLSHDRWKALKSNSKRRGMPFILTEIEFDRWFSNVKQQCEYCDVIDLTLEPQTLAGHKAQTFTIDRRNSNLPYTIDNMGISCWLCNRYKSDLFTHDEWREIAQKYIKPRWMKKLEAINA